MQNSVGTAKLSILLIAGVQMQLILLLVVSGGTEEVAVQEDQEDPEDQEVRVVAGLDQVVEVQFQDVCSSFAGMILNQMKSIALVLLDHPNPKLIEMAILKFKLDQFQLLIMFKFWHDQLTHSSNI